MESPASRPLVAGGFLPPPPIMDELVARYCRYAPHLADDIRAEALLAALEGGDVEAHLKRFLTQERARGFTRGTPRRLTPGRRRKLMRAVVIHVAHRAGLSQRWLAEALGLPRTTIQSILARAPEQLDNRPRDNGAGT